MGGYQIARAVAMARVLIGLLFCLVGDVKSHADFDVSLAVPVESSVDAERAIASASRVANERRSGLTAELRSAREMAIGGSVARLRTMIAGALEAYQASLPQSR